jgi:hypothetical protein
VRTAMTSTKPITGCYDTKKAFISAINEHQGQEGM